MSWIVHPVVDLPTPVAAAYEVLKAPIRIQLAHFLADHPASSIAAIIDGIGGDRMTIRHHLTAMDAVGVVTASPRIQGRPTAAVLYTLNRDRWTAILIGLINYLPAEQH